MGNILTFLLIVLLLVRLPCCCQPAVSSRVFKVFSLFSSVEGAGSLLLLRKRGKMTKEKIRENVV